MPIIPTRYLLFLYHGAQIGGSDAFILCFQTLVLHHGIFFAVLTLFYYFVAQRRFVCVCLSFSRLVHLALVSRPVAHRYLTCINWILVFSLIGSIILPFFSSLALVILSGAGLLTCCLSLLNLHQLYLSIFLDWLNHLTFFQFQSSAGFRTCCLSSLNLHQWNFSIFLNLLNYLTLFQSPCISKN